MNCPRYKKPFTNDVDNFVAKRELIFICPVSYNRSNSGLTIWKMFNKFVCNISAPLIYLTLIYVLFYLSKIYSWNNICYVLFFQNNTKRITLKFTWIKRMQTGILNIYLFVNNTILIINRQLIISLRSINKVI